VWNDRLEGLEPRKPILLCLGLIRSMNRKAQAAITPSGVKIEAEKHGVVACYRLHCYSSA